MHDIQVSQWKWYLSLIVVLIFIGCGWLLPLLRQSHIVLKKGFTQDTVTVIQKTMDTISELPELIQFRKEIRTAHEQAFAPYYATVTEINDDNYINAVKLCADCFNRARTMEDSLRTRYISICPLIERDMYVVIEQEMAASMSKHMSMLNEYNLRKQIISH